MPRPSVEVVDTMIGFPTDPDQLYAAMRANLLRDRESQESFVMPASYMFHDVPDHGTARDIDPVAVTLAEMDRFGIAVGLVSLTAAPEAAERALTEHPGRFAASVSVDPNRGIDAIRDLVAAHDRWNVRAVSLFPHGVSPQVPIDAPLAYPVYAKCVELGLPVFVTVGIAGPRSLLVPEGRTPRPGALRLPGARRRDATWRRALGRPRREADGQVAQPSLLDVRIRAEALSGRGDPLRKHPRRRPVHQQGNQRPLEGRADRRGS